MKVYLDHAATTPLDKRVFWEMKPYYTAEFANPSSAHGAGRSALKSMDDARDKIAEIFAVKPSETYFTAGGSESDNWAIKGCMFASREKTGRNKLLISAIEHHAAINSAKRLMKEGFAVEFIPVKNSGEVDISALSAMLDDSTALVCVMTANNETGVLQPIDKIYPLVKSAGASFFTDAVQAAGAIPLSSITQNADMVAISAHKFYGPKGVGALYIKKGTPISSVIDGGEQERGLRGGTSNVPSIVGMRSALTLAVNESDRNEKIRLLRDGFEREVLSAIADTYVNGMGERIAFTTNIAFEGVDGTILLHLLDQKGIYVSTGSACASGAIEPSHVLTAMGRSDQEAKSAIRFSLGKENTERQLDYVLTTLKSCVKKLRK